MSDRYMVKSRVNAAEVFPFAKGTESYQAARETMGRMAQFEPDAFRSSCPEPEMILRVLMK